MQANNNVTLIGRIGRDAAPDLRHTPSGDMVLNTSVAVDTWKRDSEGKKISDWWPVTLWNKQAELAADMLKKGDMVAFVGSIERQRYMADGETREREKTVIKATGFQVLTSKQDRAGQHEQNASAVQQASSAIERATGQPAPARQPAAKKQSSFTPQTTQAPLPPPLEYDEEDYENMPF